MRSVLLVGLLLVVSLARAQAPIPIPLCPLEGLDVFAPDAKSITGTNCQPKSADAEFEIARCWTRSPDALIPSYVTECVCAEHASDLLPALIPGNYAFAASTCPAGIAAVLTSLVSPRAWGTDGGCDDPGDLCPAPTSTRASDVGMAHAAALVTKERCHVFADGHMRCRKRG